MDEVIVTVAACTLALLAILGLIFRVGYRADILNPRTWGRGCWWHKWATDGRCERCGEHRK